jgi:hypothetical protein
LWGKLIGDRNKLFHHPASNIRYLIERMLSRVNHRIPGEIGIGKNFLEAPKEYAGTDYKGLQVVFCRFFAIFRIFSPNLGQ